MATDAEGSVITAGQDRSTAPRPGGGDGVESEALVEAQWLEQSRQRMVRVVRRARWVAVATVTVEVLALVACLAFLAAPTRAPITLLTFVVLGGLFVTIALAAVAVAAAVQRMAMPHTPVDDEVEVHVGWRAPVAVCTFVVAVVVTLLTVPVGVPTMRAGEYGYYGGAGFVSLSDSDYAELVLQQLRCAATFATVFAAWVAMSLTRRHPGWDSPPPG
jgi:hypothetical protein